MFWVSVLVWAPSYLLIFLFVPVESINKPLDDAERKRYGKTARIILSVEEFLSALFLFIDVQVSFVLSLSLISILIMLISGKMKLRKESSIT
jgi:accessory gene regulator B